MSHLTAFHRLLSDLNQATKKGLALAVPLLLAWGVLTEVSAKTPLQDGAVVQYPEIRAELVANAPLGVGAGKPLSLGLLLDHQPQWHTYWINPGDSGLATELQWTLPPNAQAGAIEWPVPQKIKIGSLANLGYEGQVLLPVRVDLPKGFQAKGTSFTVRLHASWLVCRQECIPQEGDFTLSIPIEGSTAIHAALFDAANQKRPVPFSGSVHAAFNGNGLALQVKGLPKAWQGKAIATFPEVSSVFATPALPDPQDHVAGGIASENAIASAGTQVWDTGTWSSILPLSAQRLGGPEEITLVFSYASDSVRVRVKVPSPWPDPKPASMVAQTIPTLSQNAGPEPTPALMSFTFASAVLAAFVGGLLLNLMPCVFPVLALKALGLATLQGSAQQRKAQAAAYTAGVLLSMMVLGALLLGLRAGGQALGWGFHLQSPPFIAGLATLFTLICLNLMNLLDVSKLVPSNLAGIQMRNPISDAALSGVLAVIVASPCTAPFMGASLGLALTLPAGQAMFIFLSLGLGLALPYALISNSATLANRLPKPGPWMEHIRQFMVFPMAATVLWLVWVLAQMVGLDAAALLALLLLCLSMALWALHLPGRAALGFGAVAILLFSLTASIGWHVASRAQALSSGAGDRQEDLWRNWSETEVRETLASGRPVFIDFTAAWCITCQYNEQQVLAKPMVLQAFKDKNVVLLRADWTRHDAAISQALEKLGRSGVPVYVLHGPGKTPMLMSELLSTEELLTAIQSL